VFKHGYIPVVKGVGAKIANHSMIYMLKA